MTTFWEDIKSAAGKGAYYLGHATQEAEIIKTRQELEERNRRIEKFTQAAKNNGYLLRYENNASDNIKILCDAFEGVANQLRRHPGLGNATLLSRPRDNNRFEREVPELRSGVETKALIIQARGLKVYALENMWAHPIALRFDTGRQEDLLALQHQLKFNLK